MKVRCIKVDKSARLELDKIYQVLRIDTSDLTYEIDDDIGQRSWWSQSRFEVIDDSSSIAVSTASGAFCQKCHNYNEYAPASPTFICFSCRS